MKNQKKIGIILTYLTQVVKIITGLVYTPIMLYLVGQSEYGLYQIADSTISYLVLINFGVLGAYAKYYTVAEKKSKKDVNEINGVFLLVLFAMSAVCIIAGMILLGNIEFIFGSGFTREEYKLSRILMLFLIVNMAISFPAGLFEHNITVNERFFTVKILAFIKTILNPFISLPLLLLGWGSIGLVFTTTLLTIIVSSIEVIYCINTLHMRFAISNRAFHMLRDIGGFTFFIFLNQVIDLINWNIDKIFIGRFIGSAAVAVYSVGGQLRQMFSSFPNAIRSVFQPQMYKMVADNKDDDTISKFFYKVGRIQSLVLIPILIGFICLGKQFIVLWTGTEYQEAYFVALCVMIPISVPHIQDIGIDLQRAKKKHQARSIVYACIAVLNVVLTIPLVKDCGIVGAAFATGVSLLLGQGLFMNFYYSKVLNVNIKYFWIKIVKIWIPHILIGVLFYIICQFFEINTWLKLVALAMFYCIIYVFVVYMCQLNDIEKTVIKSYVKKVNKRMTIRH